MTAAEPTGGSPALSLRGVVGRSPVGRVGKDKPIDLEVHGGEIGVVMGGKEVAALFRLILGLGELEKGEIVLADGRAFKPGMRDHDLANYRAGLGYAFRDKGLLSNLTVLENVDLPATYHGHYTKGQTPETLGALALEDVGVEADLWTRRPAVVSQTTRKRTLLARSIVLDPGILLIDDPTVLMPSSDYQWLLRWVDGQRRKGRAILLGTADWPFGLALADWTCDPRTGERSTDFTDLVPDTWLKAAALLKELIPET